MTDNVTPTPRGGPLSLVATMVVPLLLAVVVAALAPSAAAVASQGDGLSIYGEKCSSCHQPGGTGIPGSFPPLAGNPNAADPAHVDDVIRNGLSGPIEVLGQSYDATMAPVELDDAERAAVVDHVVSLASAEPATEASAEAEVAAPIVGDADRGRRLFRGSDRFSNGGAACVGCHEAGDAGHWGGTALGPDLDASFATFGGEAGLSAWLAAPASPTMQPIFNDEPLTEDEIADLVAFLEVAPDQDRPRSYGDALVMGGLIGVAGLIGAMALARRTIKPGYAQRLRSRR